MNQNRYIVNKNNNMLSVNFSSTINSVEHVISITKSFIEENKKAGGINFFSLHLILLESLTNAVKHGNHYDAQKSIDYQFLLLDDRVEIEIEDMGDGFNWQETIKNDIPCLTSHGRGIHIIKEYSDLFRYNKKGNKLKIIINHSS